MVTSHRLLIDIASDTPFQPATSIWRAIELAELLSIAFPEGRGLDVGCGDGYILKRVLEHAGPREMVGVDLDPRETEAAKESGVYKTVYTGLASEVPEPDASFDFAFSNSVLEHIPDLAPVFAEVARLLKPGGTFVFTVPSTLFHDALSGPWIPGKSREEYCAMVDKRVAHAHYFSPENCAEWLEPCGMVVESTKHYFSGKAVRRWENVARMTSGVLFSLLGEKKHPIEIQHALRIRKKRRGILSKLAVLFARLASTGVLTSTEDPDGRYGCLLVVSRKPAASAATET